MLVNADVEVKRKWGRDEKGYVKNNIRVISLLANQMKWNATPEELESFCVGMLQELGKVGR